VALDELATPVALRVTPVLAESGDAPALLGLRDELAAWMVANGIPGWQPGEMPLSSVEGAIDRGEVFVLEDQGELVGSVSVMWSDPVIWGDRPDDAGYVHGLMVRRSRAGANLGRELLAWAELHIRRHGRPRARLDCVSTNKRLRRYYEDAGYTLVGFNDLRDVTTGVLFSAAPLPAALYEKDLQ
jgi:protein-tyrosine phosphatase